MISYRREKVRKFHSKLEESKRERMTVFSVGDSSMDAELYLSPRAGLVYAQNLRE
jgi:hypothetical protein